MCTPLGHVDVLACSGILGTCDCISMVCLDVLGRFAPFGTPT